MGWGGVGWGAWVILMSTPGPFPLKGEMFLTCVAELDGTSGPDLELNNFTFLLNHNRFFIIQHHKIIDLNNYFTDSMLNLRM